MRRANDFYPTPAWATKMLIDRVLVRGEILEPCAGKGDMARVLGTIPGSTVLTNDLDKAMPSSMHMDATDWSWWKGLSYVGPIRWVVTNPPFSVADRILPHAVKFATEGAAFLLRLSYLEPCTGRASWLSENPPTRLLVLPRISFTGDGKTDSATCAWFVWERYPSERGVQIVVPTVEGSQALFHEVQEIP